MRRFVACCAALAAVAVAGPGAAQELLINGAGATFPNPLYQKWFSEYHTLHSAIGFNYQSIGSGGGIQQFTAGTVDFGASDAPLTDDEWAKIKDAVHIPTVLGAVVITYNAPVQGLKLTPEVLAGVYLGKLTKWNDPALVAVNPGLKLPDTDISVMHRADGSGTTSIFTDYLAKVSPEWKEKVGAGKSVKWPVGLGGKGNDGVTGLVKQTPGAIGYVELAYAQQNGLSMAQLRNKAGAFVTPSIESTSAAAAGVPIPDDYRVSVTNADGKDAYPIASFTYLLVHKDAKDPAKGKALVEFLWWAVHDGQKYAAALDYAPLPKAVVDRVSATIRTLTVQGKSVSIATR
jgi:phosphate transport system substrate-binding protein